MGLTQSEGLAGDETSERQQSSASVFHSLRKSKSVQGDCANLVFQNVPRRHRSKLPKETVEVFDSGKGKTGIIQGHQRKNHSVAGQRGGRRKKRKLIADSSDDNVIFRRFRVRGQRRGLLNSSKRGKLDSKTFEEYMEHIWSTFPGKNRNLFLHLDSLWFSLYSQKSLKEKVLKWVKKKDLFSKKYVLVPIVMWSHWSLLILCNFGENPQSKSKAPCMLLLDSLQTANPKRLEPGIRKFVWDICNIHQRPGKMESICKIPLLVPKVPQQRNGEECGSFVLYYISLFLQNAPEDFSRSEGYPYFMTQDWFTLEEFDNFCKKLDVESNPKNSLSSDE